MGSCEEGTEPEAKCVAFMKLAIEQAKLALDSLEVPVGCIIVKDHKVISSGRNRTTETRNATRHAEMEAIDVLLEQWQKNGLTKEEIASSFSKCALYVTCEPCIMCAAALSVELKKYIMAVQMISSEVVVQYCPCIQTVPGSFLAVELRKGRDSSAQEV